MNVMMNPPPTTIESMKDKVIEATRLRTKNPEFSFPEGFVDIQYHYYDDTMDTDIWLSSDNDIRMIYELVYENSAEAFFGDICFSVTVNRK